MTLASAEHKVNQNINFCMKFHVRFNFANILPDYDRDIEKLQRVQKCLACVVCKASRFSRLKPLLYFLGYQ